MKNLNILTLNCQWGYDKNLSHYLKSLFASQKYDVIFLQEITKFAQIILNKNLEKYSYKIVQPSYKNKLVEMVIIYRKNFILKDSFFGLYTQILKPEFLGQQVV